MTNYNDGNWWGWNGGECPVHPKTRVEVVYYEDAIPDPVWLDQDAAGDFNWQSDTIIAFRVTREHREPREWWMSGGRVFDCAKSAHQNIMGCGMDDYAEVVHVREVLDE